MPESSLFGELVWKPVEGISMGWEGMYRSQVYVCLLYTSVSVTLFSSLKRFSFTCKDLIIRKLTIVLLGSDHESSS